MGEIEYNGKKYQEPAEDSQRVLHTVNIHTFRFFPKEKLFMASDMCAKEFGLEKFYPNAPESLHKDFLYVKDWEKNDKIYKKVSEGEPQASACIRSPDGKNYYRLSMAVIEWDEDGNSEVVAGIVEEYDEYMRATELIQMLSDDYYSVFHVDFKNDEVTAYRTLDMIDGKFEEFFAKKSSYGETMSLLIKNEVIDEEKAIMKRVTSYENLCKRFKEKRVYMHDFQVIKDEKQIYTRFKAVNLSAGDELTHCVLGFANVDNEKRGEWERLAYISQITGGYNITYYSEMLKSENRKGYIVSTDIKSFKIINNVCGIAKGDEILGIIGKCIEDVLGSKGFYGHVNADHFVFFVAEESDEAVIELLDRLSADIKDKLKDEDIPKISPYYGVTKWKPGLRRQVAFSEANTAKHNVKESNSVNYSFYREEDNQRAIEAKKIEDAFEKAIKEKEFEIWYQPKYSPINAELTGAEALIRWKRADGSYISPGAFIPVYEKNGMIRQLDEYVFKEVCTQQREWIDTIGRTVPVSVNLSRVSLYFESIVEEFKRIADDIGILPELVPIEVTETAAVDNRHIKVLADEFYEAGFPLHIDDFGTGYSSLSTLNMMRFDTLKLDKSLIDYIGDFGGDRTLKHTIQLAKDLGLHVTAEGVETEDQVEFLQREECDNIQGFYYSRPIPAMFFAEKLQSEKISDKYMYRKGQEYTFTLIVDRIKRYFAYANNEKDLGHAAIQINVTGEGEGSFYVEIQEERVDVQPYEYFDRDALIVTDAECLFDMAKGALGVEQAYMDGKIRVEGDWGAVLLLKEIIIRRQRKIK